MWRRLARPPRHNHKMKNNSAIVLLLLSLGLFYTFTNDQYKDARRLQALAGEYRNILQNVSAIVESRDRLLVTYETFPKAEIERINKILPDNIDTVRLALDLDDMATRHGIAIKSIQATTGTGGDEELVVLPENDKLYERATVTFSFVSNYANFMSFIEDIER